MFLYFILSTAIHNIFFYLNFVFLTEGSPKEWREILDVNVVGLSLCTRETVASLRERRMDDGLIVNISR